MTLSLSAALLGLVLGLRFRVLVLVPATALLWIVLAIFALGHSATAGDLIRSMLWASAALECGYLGGVGTRLSVTTARLPRRTPSKRASEAALS